MNHFEDNDTHNFLLHYLRTYLGYLGIYQHKDMKSYQPNNFQGISQHKFEIVYHHK